MQVPFSVRAWWRGRRQGGRSETTVCSRVTIPAVVDPPVDVLRVLREYDPRLDVYVLPWGKVWLLIKSDTPARMHEGRKELASAREDGLPPDRSSLLMAAGFELLEEVPLARLSGGYLLRVAKEKLETNETAVRHAMEAKRRESNGQAEAERRAATIIERVTADAAFDHKWAYRGKRAFSAVM